MTLVWVVSVDFLMVFLDFIVDLQVFNGTQRRTWGRTSSATLNSNRDLEITRRSLEGPWRPATRRKLHLETKS